MTQEEQQSLSSGTNEEEEQETQEEQGQEQQQEQEQQQKKKGSKGVEKVLSERNQLREENKNLKSELEEMKKNGVSTDDEQYLEKLAEQKAKEEREKLEKERERNEFIQNYGDDKLDEIEKYVEKGLSYQEASLLVRGQENINYNSETMVGNEKTNVEGKDIDNMSLDEARSYLLEKEKNMKKNI